MSAGDLSLYSPPSLSLFKDSLSLKEYFIGEYLERGSLPLRLLKILTRLCLEDLSVVLGKNSVDYQMEEVCQAILAGSSKTSASGHPR